MQNRYFTASFDLHNTSFLKDPRVGEMTVILVDIHPMVFYACFPHFNVQPGPMRHWSPVDPGDGPALLAAYRAMGGEERIYTLGDVHDRILAYIEYARTKDFTPVDANRKLAGLQAWANSIGVSLDAPRAATA